MVQQMEPIAGRGIEGNVVQDVSLEKKLSLSIIASEDSDLEGSASPTLQPNYNLDFPKLPAFMRSHIEQPTNICLVDLLHLPVDYYDTVIDKIKQIRAINIESKVMILATGEQQAQESFNLFREANERGLVEVSTRPDPKESEYAADLSAMVGKLPNSLDELYKHGKNGKFENVEVVKIGGSIFDLLDRNVLHSLLTTIVEIHQDHDLILTVGGGPLQSVPADYRTSLGISDFRYQESSRAQITQQALTVVDLLRQISPEEDKVAYMPPENMVRTLKDNWITREFLMGKIPVFSYLPEESEEIGIPKTQYSASDAHTVRFADALGSGKVIFLKNTDGIYRRDPNLPKTFWNKLREPFREGKNDFFDFVYAPHIEDRIERLGLTPRGEVTDEHLIETLALQPFIDSRYLHTIQIVNGTKPQELVNAMDGIKAGSYILK